MKIRPTAEQRAELLASQLAQPLEVASIMLRASEAGAAVLSTEERDALLARCAAREYVELYLEIDAYEQREGEHNRAAVRLTPGAMAPAARSAKGRPFLRDHLQNDTLARGGEIIEAKSIKRGDGDYVIRMTVKLTAIWAVEMALRGLLSFVSIGLRPTGPVLCSCCGTEVFTECWHVRGEQVVAKLGDEPQVCEWIYTAAEIVEASSVNVPAVVGAHIESIRAALSAAANNSGTSPQGKFMLARLATILTLAATASETEVLSAVEAQSKRVKSLEAENRIATTDLAAVTSERDALLAEKTERESKAFIDDAIASGQIAPADSETWSALYAADKPKAIALMSARKPGTATPVGRPRQTPPAAPADPTASAPAVANRIDAALSAANVDPALARKFAAMFGATNPDAALAAALEITEG